VFGLYAPNRSSKERRTPVNIGVDVVLDVRVCIARVGEFPTVEKSPQEESTGSKVARCLFAYCAGIGGHQTATVQLIDTKTQEVALAYNVRKGGAANYQSSSEAVAKHLKKFVKQHAQSSMPPAT
jgi:hypothetical protein